MPTQTLPTRSYKVHRVTLSVVREHDPLLRLSGRLKCNSPAETVAIIRDLDLLPDEARERMICLMLDAQNGLIGVHEVSVGTLSATLITPREMFRAACVLPGVASLILAHNHPSGDPTASREDHRLTRQLADAGRLMDIKIHDHLILGDGPEGRYLSLFETAPADFGG